MEVKDLSAGMEVLNQQLVQALVQCNDRIDAGKRNAEAAKSVDMEILRLTNKIEDVRSSINYTNRIFKNAQKFLELRKEASLEDLREMLQKAIEIVPSADVKGVKLDIDGKHARLVNEKGGDINAREGSAVRTVLGVLIKYVALSYDPGAIKIILFDENFNTLSNETLNVMRDTLLEFSKDMAIVAIEQQPVLFEGIVSSEFQVEKQNGVSTVTKLY